MTDPRRRHCAAILTLLLAATATAHGVESGSVSAEPRSAEIERSPADTRDYRAFVLDNGLEALVVSDPEADEAAAALNVNVGGGSDPEDRPGLAHFLEHMLFLGTEKYPDAGEYGRYLAEHGGSSNATTSFAHTSYFFDIDAEYLEGALDRFAQFFVAPRFDREYVARERQVVHSEYVSRRRSDRLRGFAAWRQTLDPRHPLSKFLVGNAQTLADRPGADIRDELIDFHERAYSSHLMKLVVVGREPLHVLEGWVRARFAAVPRRDHDPPRIVTPLYPEGRLPARLEIEPVRELRTISLSFAVPSLRPHYRAHPLTLVSHLLGHEGRGSLLSALKARGWAEGLSAGPGMRHRDFATFMVTIQATEAGLAHRDDVVAAVFAYLDLIREEGIEPRYHEELARMARIAFRFQEKAAPRSWAVSLARALHVYPPAELLTAPWRFGDFQPEVERRYLSSLTPDRVLVTVVAKGVTTDSVAPFHDTPYRLTPIPAATVARWRDAVPDVAFALPEPNPFVPGDLEVIDAQAAGAGPERIVSRPGFDLWHHADVEFGQPRTNFYFSVRSPIAGDSARHAVLSSLLARMANDALNEFAYPAALAGQSHSIYRHRRGLSVRLSGWSDKQDLLLARIVSTLRALPLPVRRFEAEKAEYARRLRNVDERRPSHRAMGDVREMLLDPYWSDDALLEALDTVALDDLREYAVRFFERGRDRRPRPRERHRRRGEGARPRAGARAARLDAGGAGSSRPRRAAGPRDARRAMARERARRSCARRLPSGARSRIRRAGDDGAARAGGGKTGSSTSFAPSARSDTSCSRPCSRCWRCPVSRWQSSPRRRRPKRSTARSMRSSTGSAPRCARCGPPCSNDTAPRWRAPCWRPRRGSMTAPSATGTRSTWSTTGSTGATSFSRRCAPSPGTISPMPGAISSPTRTRPAGWSSRCRAASHSLPGRRSGARSR